jgi:cellulose biosynthesis protein BcsQ
MLKRKPLQIFSNRFVNLDPVPSHIPFSNTDIELFTTQVHRESRLKMQLDPIGREYGHVTSIDCPPTLPWLTLIVFDASDTALVVALGYFKLESPIQTNRQDKCRC